MLFKFLTIYLLSLLSSGTNTEISDFQPYVNMEDGSMSIICSTTNTLYVDSSSVGGDGTSWLHAFNNLDTALFVAWQCPDIDTILVAEGTYVPHNLPYDMGSDLTGTFISNAENRDKTFHIRQGLNIYGGYPSGGGQRNFRFNKTILSGAGVGDVLSDSAYHVVFIDTSGYWPEPLDTTVLSGFEIIYGRSEYNGFINVNNRIILRVDGSAILMNESVCLIKNNVIKNCETGSGSIFISGGAQRLTGNFFVSNYGGEGAAISAQYCSSEIFNNVFYSNETNNSIIWCSTGNFNITNNTIVENETRYGNHALRLDGGIAELNNNIFFGNSIRNSDTLGGDFGASYVELTTRNNLFQLPDSSHYSSTNGNSLGFKLNNIFDSYGRNNPRFRSSDNIVGPDQIWGTKDDGLVPFQGSPVINSGANEVILGHISMDVVDSARIIENVVNIGAYEIQTASICPQTNILYVDSSAVGGDGTTWEKAFQNLDTALFIAWQCPEVDSILIALGTYKPDRFPYTMKSNLTSEAFHTDDHQDKTFHIRQGLKLLGGYPAGGGTRDLLSKSILSGANINSTVGDTAYHVVFVDSSKFWRSYDNEILLDGLQVSGGRASESTLFNDTHLRSAGAGIYFSHGNLKVSNSIITNNKATEFGGGVFHYFGRLTLNDNIIQSCSSELSGGGLYSVHGTLDLTGNKIEMNQSRTGGGMRVTRDHFKMKENYLARNMCYGGSGGAAIIDYGMGEIESNVFDDNYANANGGAVWILNSAELLIVNNLFNRNGYNAVYTSMSTPSVINNTFVANFGGAVETHDDTCRLYNNIFYDNHQAYETTVPRVDIYNRNTYIFAEHNVFQLNDADYSSGNYNELAYQKFNLFESQGVNNPNFLAVNDPDGPDNIFGTEDDGFILMPGSVAMDSGDSTFVPKELSTDLAGQARFQGNVDIGAYEGYCPDCPCPSIYHINDHPIVTSNYQAKTFIKASGSVESTSLVHFQAGKEISLQPGFNIAVGGIFEGAIETCDEMIPNSVKIK